MTQRPSRPFGWHGRSLILLWLALAGYWCLYEQCVRTPRVSLRSWRWPYYAVGGPQWSPSEFRLPDAPAEWFFWPAFQLDRRLHPKYWAEENPKEVFAEFFRNGHTVVQRGRPECLSRSSYEPPASRRTSADPSKWVPPVESRSFLVFPRALIAARRPPA